MTPVGKIKVASIDARESVFKLYKSAIDLEDVEILKKARKLFRLTNALNKEIIEICGDVE